MAPPDWPTLCQLTSVPNWDLEGGRIISRDLWWAAKLFYIQMVDLEETCWLWPFVSPCGDGSINFIWTYGFRKLNIEITDGLWQLSEKDVCWGRVVDGVLPEEAPRKVNAFYVKCGRDKR